MKEPPPNCSEEIPVSGNIEILNSAKGKPLSVVSFALLGLLAVAALVCYLVIKKDGGIYGTYVSDGYGVHTETVTLSEGGIIEVRARTFFDSLSGNFEMRDNQIFVYEPRLLSSPNEWERDDPFFYFGTLEHGVIIASKSGKRYSLREKP